MIVAYENETSPLAQMAMEWELEGHETIIVQGDPTCVTTLPSILDKHHETGYIKNVHTMESSLFKTSERNNSPDWKYLRDFEKKYCKSKNLMQLAMTDPILFDFHHYRRPYYKQFEDSGQAFAFLESILRWLEGLIEWYSPDALVMVHNNYLVKNVAAVIGDKRGCSVLSLAPGRVGNFWYITSMLDHDFDDIKYIDFVKAINQVENTETAEAYFSDKLNHQNGLYESPNRKVSRERKLFTITGVFSELFFGIKTATKNKLKLLFRLAKGKNSPKILFYKSMRSTLRKVIIFRARIALNQTKYIIKNPFSSEIPSESFLFLPLHTLPESSTLTLSTEYFEADLIRYISKELPAGMKLVVKENTNMIGIRFWSSYENVKLLPNVVLADPNNQTNNYIKESAGVVGISGTALLEGVLMGKPAHCFGTPEFMHAMNSVGYESFPSFAEGCYEGKIKPKKEAALKHIQYIMNHGKEVDINAIKKPKSSDSESSLRKVMDLFSEALY